MVACDNIALFVNAKAAVCVAVVCEAHVQAIVDNEFLQMFDVRGAAVGIDIVPVRSVVDHVRLCAQSVKDTFRDRPGGAVGRVQTDLYVFKSEFGKRYQVPYIPVPARDVVNGASDVPCRQRHFELSVNIVLDLADGLFVHLLALAVQELDAVVIVRVMRGGDHYSAIEVVNACDVRDGRCGGDVHDVRVRPGSHQPGAKRIFEHI